MCSSDLEMSKISQKILIFYMTCSFALSLLLRERDSTSSKPRHNTTHTRSTTSSLDRKFSHSLTNGHDQDIFPHISSLAEHPPQHKPHHKPHDLTIYIPQPTNVDLTSHPLAGTRSTFPNDPITNNRTILSSTISQHDKGRTPHGTDYVLPRRDPLPGPPPSHLEPRFFWVCSRFRLLEP